MFMHSVFCFYAHAIGDQIFIFVFSLKLLNKRYFILDLRGQGHL